MWGQDVEVAIVGKDDIDRQTFEIRSLGFFRQTFNNDMIWLLKLIKT